MYSNKYNFIHIKVVQKSMRFSHQNEQRRSAEFSKINRYTKKSHVSTGTTGQIIERLVEMKGGGAHAIHISKIS